MTEVVYLCIGESDSAFWPLAQPYPTLTKSDRLHSRLHSAMGKSRSAAVVIAYLISKYHLTPEAALKQLQRGRGVCDPNDGFKDQLKLYHDMGTPDDVESQPIYQRWLYQKALSASRACGIAPDANEIRFEDEHVREDNGKVDFELKCKKCRRVLASSAYLVKHVPRELKGMVKDESVPDSPSTCQHYFLDALSWMKPELEQGRIDGRLECPKCRTNVGRYAWQGMQCSCGDWVVPGISLAKGRVDAAVVRMVGGREDAGLRLPPGGGAVRGAHKGNL